MSETLILEFAQANVEDYNAVNEILGIDPANGKGDVPDGLLAHVAAANGDHLVVVEVWETQGQQEDFMKNRLSSALDQIGLPAPSRLDWMTTAGTIFPEG